MRFNPTIQNFEARVQVCTVSLHRQSRSWPKRRKNAKKYSSREIFASVKFASDSRSQKCLQIKISDRSVRYSLKKRALRILFFCLVGANEKLPYFVRKCITPPSGSHKTANTEVNDNASCHVRAHRAGRIQHLVKRRPNQNFKTRNNLLHLSAPNQGVVPFRRVSPGVDLG